MKTHLFLYARHLKRPFDALASAAGLVLLSPLLASAALLVRCHLGSPVIFRQKRPGRGEIIFTMYKFRTMTDEKDAAGRLLPDRERLSPFGRFLRSFSLDELPGLFNALKGDMSLVGPRPLLVEYLPLYSREQRKRHCVRPGITGLAQVSGRNAITWEEKFALDVYYAKNAGFFLDCRIMLSTVVKMLKREGINKTSDVTMEKFTGSLKR